MDSRQKVMVVDDDPGMRLTLEGIIEDEGFDVVGAADGYQAIDLAGNAHYPLIFMDIKMPGINGVDTYREIKKVSPGSVVVMMTGYSVTELVAQALEEGAYAVTYKPFDIAQIIETVRTVLKTTVVLVVDDQAADRITLGAILEENGYQVNEARSGAEAVQMAAAKHYSVILLDLKMPGMDGLATLERIRAFDPLVRIIFISGFALEEPVLQGLRSGAYAVLAKPTEPGEIVALIRSITLRASRL